MTLGGAVAATGRLGLGRLRGYRRRDLPGDVGAGLLVAALAAPQSLGYAAVAGVPVQVGLYTLPPALLAYALLGSSRLLFMGPVSTVSVLSGSIVRQLADGDPVLATRLTAALAVVAGLVLLAAGLLKVGWVARFLSVPIVTGFVAGLVVLIVVGEIPGLLGLPPPAGALLERLLALARDLPRVEPTTLAVAVTALVVLFGGQRWAPRVPWSLLVLVAGVMVSRVADLPGRGVPTVGDVPTGLPRPWLPWVGVEHLGGLVVGGIAVAAVGIAEGLAAARTFAHAKENLDDDTELLANGAADVAAGLFGGMGVAGSLSKTAANARAGAHTQLSGVVSAAVVVLVLLVAAGLISPLPRAVLSAIVIHAVWRLVQPSAFGRYRRIRRNDFVGSLVAFGGVLLLGPLNGLLIAIGQSLLGLVYRSMQVEIDVLGKVAHEKAAYGAVAHDPTRETIPGVLVLRPNGPVFWANADPVFERISRLLRDHPDTCVLVLDLEASNQLDTTTAERLEGLLTDLRARGRDLFLVRVFGNVKRVLERTGFLERLGEEHVWHSISASVKAAKRVVAAEADEGVAEPVEDDSDHLVVRSVDEP